MKKVENSVLLTEAEFARLQRAAGRERRRKRGSRKLFRSITVTLFVTTQVAALSWVTISYAIAVYATVRLGQPFPIETLSEAAVTSLLGVSALKVIENIFEHNDGVVWGTSKKEPAEESADNEIAG